MAFNVDKYKGNTARTLPVLLILDVSGSMGVGGKIQSLQKAVEDMLNGFDKAQVKEKLLKVAIITFGGQNEVKLLRPLNGEFNEKAPFLTAGDFLKRGVGLFAAEGKTPMGAALNMSKDLLDDLDILPKKETFVPAVVLVSDGIPTDEWKDALNAFVNEGQTKKTQRFALAIGSDADQNMLEEFTCNPENVLFAKDAAEIIEKFNEISRSITSRAKSSDSGLY